MSRGGDGKPAPRRNLDLNAPLIEKNEENTREKYLVSDDEELIDLNHAPLEKVGEVGLELQVRSKQKVGRIIKRLD